MMNANASHRTRAAPTIEDLPDEVLALVIQQLECRDRVRLERVSRRWRDVALARGWTKVRDLRELVGGKGRAQRRQLLDRAGHYITRLEIEKEVAAGIFPVHLWNELQLPTITPNLRHIAAWWHQLNVGILNFLRTNYAMNLKSLQICVLPHPRPDPFPTMAETLDATIKLLRRCSSLENLVLEGDSRSIFRTKRIDPDSLPELRYLHLAFSGLGEPTEGERATNEEIVEGLFSLHSLRSLTLYLYRTEPDFVFPQPRVFPHLECLEVGVAVKNLDHLVITLPNLEHLRAVTIYITEEWKFPISIVLAERLILAISSLPRLEYLKMRLGRYYSDASGKAMKLEEAVKRFYPPLITSQQLQSHLRALVLSPPLLPSMLPWVETLPELEFFGSFDELPLSYLYTMVRKCKKLRHIELEQPYKPSRSDLCVLIEAAAERGEPQEGAEGNTAHIPPVSIKVDESCYKNAELPDMTLLRFVYESDYPRRIRDAYRYGAQSEQPNFCGSNYHGAL